MTPEELQPGSSNELYVERSEWKEVVERCEKILLDAGSRGIYFLSDPIIGEFTQRMKGHPDFRKTRLYHVLLGSTPFQQDPPTILDVYEKDGEGKIEKFIREVVDKLGR